MFDKLVESQKIKNGRKVGRYLTATAILYGAVLAIFTIVTIVGYGPVLAEYDKVTILPLVPTKSVDSTPQTPKQQKAVAVTGGGATLAKLNENVKVVVDLPPGSEKFITYARSSVNSGPPGNLLSGSNYGKPGSDGEVPPPPPSTAKPAPTPESKQGLAKVSEGVLQGGALHKEKPAYPALPKQMRISGIVQVQVLISVDGKVLQATAINGPALLQRAAVEAARQWRFSPTTLSKVPVMVQGIISFNFTLN